MLIKPFSASPTIEVLEARIAPALVLASNGLSATFTDVDGDLVIVKVTKSRLAAEHFDLSPANSLGGQQLRQLALDESFAGSNVAITVKGVPGGNGLVNVGEIAAEGVDLKNVSVAGDLGRLLAGGTSETLPGVAALTVGSLGRAGTAVQLPSADLISVIAGKLGRLSVKGDVFEASVLVEGSLGAVSIGGSLIGGDEDNSGQIIAGTNPPEGDPLGRMGAVKIGRNLEGGAGEFSGHLSAAGNIASVTIAGDVLGGGSAFAGSVRADDLLGAVRVGGSLIAGAGELSATISAATMIKSVTIQGSIFGEVAESSEFEVIGGAAVISSGGLGPITVKGSVKGGDAVNSGGIYAFGGNIKSVIIGRDLTGTSSSSGIYAAGTIGAVTVGGSIIGKTPGEGSVFILADGNQNPETPASALAIGKVTIKGRVENADILAGSNFYSAGQVVTIDNADAQIGTVTVGGDWIASNLAAGINSTGAPLFGSIDEQEIAGSNLNPALSSRLISINIAGNLVGTPEFEDDRFGFFAQQIGSLKIHGIPQKLTVFVDALIKLGDPETTDTWLAELGGT